MSNGNGSTTVPDTSYYDYLVATHEVARTLVERLIFQEEPALAANANLIRVQIEQLLDGELQGQVDAIPPANLIV